MSGAGGDTVVEPVPVPAAGEHFMAPPPPNEDDDDDAVNENEMEMEDDEDDEDYAPKEEKQHRTKRVKSEPADDGDQTEPLVDKSNAYRCHLCANYATIDPFNLQVHLNESHDVPYCCDECSFRCMKRADLETHVRVSHPESAEADKKYFCKHCPYSAARADHLNNHVRRVHQKVRNHKCDQCDKAFFNRYQLDQHVISVHENRKAFECPKCPFKSNRKDNLQAHVKLNHDESQVFTCSHCDFTCNRELHLRRHVRKTHRKKVVLACPQCTYTSHDRHNLNCHIRRTHEQVKPHQCHLCDYACFQRTHLTLHIKANHENIRDFLCNECGYKAARRDHLHKHIKFVHKKIKPFKCEQCSFAAAERGTLNRHVAAVHRKEKPFLCQYCGFSSTFKGNLKQHVNKLHEKFPCPVDWCKYRATSQELLSEHMNTVSHEKPKPKARPSTPPPPPPTKRKAPMKISRKQKYEEEVMGIANMAGSDLLAPPAKDGDLPLEPAQTMEVGSEPIAALTTSAKVEPPTKQECFNCFIPGCGFVGTTPEELEWHTNSFHFSGAFFQGEISGTYDYLQDGDYIGDDFEDLDEDVFGDSEDGINEDEYYDSGDSFVARKRSRKMKKKRKHREHRDPIGGGRRLSANRPTKSSKYLVDIEKNIFLCNHCDVTFTRSDHLLRHMKRTHRERHYCDSCKKSFAAAKKLQAHKQAAHDAPVTMLKPEAEQTASGGGDDDAQPPPVEAETEAQDEGRDSDAPMPPPVDDTETQAADGEKVEGDEAAEAPESDGESFDGDGEFHECPLCSQYFLLPQRLELHLEQQHGPDSEEADGKVPIPATCLYCEEDFPSRAAMRKHVRKVHEVLACCQDGCNFRTATQEALDEHEANFKHEFLIKREPTIDDDEEEGIRVKPKVEAVSEGGAAGSTAYRCRADDCGFQGVTREEILFHVQVNHAEMVEAVEDWLEVEEMQHAKSSSSKKRGFRGGAAKYGAAAGVKTSFLCERCDFSTSRKDHLRRHIQRVHEKLKPHKCPSCDHRFFSKYHMQIHYKAIHEGCKEIRCPECDYTCNRKDHLNVHMRTNHSDSNVPMCTLCDFKGESKWHLEQHMNTEHTELQTFQCTLCSWTFDRKDRYEDHVRREHQNIQDTECVICGFKAKDKTEYEMHLKNAHKRTGDIKCPDCEYVAKRKDHLIKHIEFVHRKVKPFSCAQCSFAASQRGAINRHIAAVHRKEKPYLCQYCGFSASFKGNLKQHVQKVHEKFACPIDGCKFRTATQPDLDNHLSVVHETATSLKCVQCNLYFPNLNDLNAHFLKEHLTTAQQQQQQQQHQAQQQPLQLHQHQHLQPQQHI